MLMGAIFPIWTCQAILIIFIDYCGVNIFLNLAKMTFSKYDPALWPSRAQGSGRPNCQDPCEAAAFAQSKRNTFYKMCTMSDHRRRRWADVVQML